MRDDGSVPSYNDRLEQQLARARVRWAEWFRERIHSCVLTYVSIINSDVRACIHSPRFVLLLLYAHSYLEPSLRGLTKVPPRSQNATKLLACREPYRERLERRPHGITESEPLVEVIVSRPHSCLGALSVYLPVGSRKLMSSGGAV